MVSHVSPRHDICTAFFFFSPCSGLRHITPASSLASAPPLATLPASRHTLLQDRMPTQIALALIHYARLLLAMTPPSSPRPLRVPHPGKRGRSSSLQRPTGSMAMSAPLSNTTHSSTMPVGRGGLLVSVSMLPSTTASATHVPHLALVTILSAIGEVSAWQRVSTRSESSHPSSEAGNALTQHTCAGCPCGAWWRACFLAGRFSWLARRATRCSSLSWTRRFQVQVLVFFRWACPFTSCLALHV